MARKHSEWASLMLICGPNDVVPLVLDGAKPLPHYWKLPGGGKEPGESPKETAIREAEEEVGIRVSKAILLKEEDRGNHMLYLFGAWVETFDQLKTMGDEGERVALYSVTEIEEMVDFFPPHRRLLNEIQVLKK